MPYTVENDVLPRKVQSFWALRLQDATTEILLYGYRLSFPTLSRQMLAQFSIRARHVRDAKDWCRGLVPAF